MTMLRNDGCRVVVLVSSSLRSFPGDFLNLRDHPTLLLPLLLRSPLAVALLVLV